MITEINGYRVDTTAPIYMDDEIIRRSNFEVAIANDEWYGELHEDWVKIVKPEFK